MAGVHKLKMCLNKKRHEKRENCASIKFGHQWGFQKDSRVPKKGDPRGFRGVSGVCFRGFEQPLKGFLSDFVGVLISENSGTFQQ